MAGTVCNKMLKITNSIIFELGIVTTKILNERQDKLKSIVWRDGEANLDTGYSKLACRCCEEAWNDVMKKKYTEYRDITITCEIPDINITFTYLNVRIQKDKIELKSSKSKTMPGSTIKKLDINQPLIYCLRPSPPSEEYIVRCSQYHNAMGESDTELFQDRTPRPFISFEKMGHEVPYLQQEQQQWVSHYAECALNRIENPAACKKKSWQDEMIKILKEKIIDDYVRNTSEQQFQMDKLSLQVENTHG